MSAILANWIASDGRANVEARLVTQLRHANTRLARANERATAAAVEQLEARRELDRIVGMLRLVRKERAA